ncbi:unnamed protein product [Chrysodeixis includens]|uniref:Adenylate kinase 8 n=1 Tax=Chrysodeixis includens TaxID=689277 RepID=A0A9P0BXL8_CHRIL|nr:unnamed protein product [Chrysodeixis includens]
MTETDKTKRPLQMPVEFLPYLERYRVYQMLKDMTRDLIVHLPKDHLKHMKIFLSKHMHATEAPRMLLLIAPDLTIDVKCLAKQMIKDFGCFVVTRRCVMDRYEKHDDYVPGCMSPQLMSEVTKNIVTKDPVPNAGWLMFDHPCTVREARCLQQDGVLPTVTLVLSNTPPVAPQTPSNLTPSRNFFQQDFEGLKFAYKATLKEVYIDPEDDSDKITNKCFNAVRAFNSGAQGPKQGISVVGAPGVYRVLLLGPRGSGRRSQAHLLAKHFGLVYLHFDAVFNEAKAKDDELGQKIRNFGTSIQLRAEAVKRRLIKKDCIAHGWVMTGFPTCGSDFELLDNMPTPPNRIIFLNIDVATCRERSSKQGVDWCTGETVPLGSGPRVVVHPMYDAERLEQEWDTYFTESLAELRAAAGITAAEVDATEPFDKVHVKIQAAVIAAPPFDIECCSQLRNVRAD